MKIYYQGDPGSYSHLASMEVQNKLNQKVEDVCGVMDFDTVWEKVSEGHVGVIPIENSYAGTIHQNVYNFLRFNHKIIGEYNFEVRHCLMSLEDDISKIREVYSHHQALSQTHKYIHSHRFTAKPYGDTAGAAKMILDKQKFGIAAIASELAAEIYGLNILEKDIQDQEGNTTKFLIIGSDTDSTIDYEPKRGRITILFTTKDTPGKLQSCLNALGERNINMTKIESIPMTNGRFMYGFWVTFEGSTEQHHVLEALGEFQEKAESFKILGEY